MPDMPKSGTDTTEQSLGTELNSQFLEVAVKVLYCGYIIKGRKSAVICQL